MGGWKRAATVAIALSALVGCFEEDTADNDAGRLAEIAPAAGPSDTAIDGTDKVVDIVTTQVVNACLTALPEPNVESDTPARLGLTLDDFSYSFEEGRHRFTHNRRFKESTGIGLYIYRGKVCVNDATECADACVRYRVEPGGSLTQRGHHFATPVDPDRITLQYWARDDAGHSFTILQEIQTEGEAAEIRGGG